MAKDNLISEFENFKKEVLDSLNKIDNWSIMVGNVIMNMANAIDNADRNLLNLIYDTDKKLRQDIDFELNKLMKNYNFSVYNNNLEKVNLKTKINKLDEELLSIKNIADINLIFHNSKFQELEQLICSALNKQEVNPSEVDHYLFQNHSFKRNKIRKFKGKEISLTLPVYVRHYFNHKSNDNNNPPTVEEIDNSIQLMLNVIQILKK